MQAGLSAPPSAATPPAAALPCGATGRSRRIGKWHGADRPPRRGQERGPNRTRSANAGGRGAVVRANTPLAPQQDELDGNDLA